MKETRFKQTEIGLIPEDWEVLYLYNISQNAMYGVGASAVKYDGINKYIRITDINDTNGCFEPMPLVSPEWFLDKYIVKENDILIARTGASVGKCYLYKQSDGKLIFAGFLMRLNIINADSKFTFYQLCTKYYKNWIASESARTGQPGVNLQQIKSFGIPSPQSMREQNKIASALTSIDNLLLSIDKLIEKKRLIKQGAMQELLTGKKRLPGFTGEWVERQVKDLGSIGRGRVISQKEIERSYQHKYPVYSSQTQNNGVMGYIDTYDFEGEYITWTTDGVNAGTVFHRNGLFNCTNVCGTIKLHKDNHLFVSMRLGLETNNYVSTNLANPKLMNNVMKQIVIDLPETIEEQRAIATVLSSMDKEIESLEGKKAKYEQIKQGMMQQLLTGKIRLIS